MQKRFGEKRKIRKITTYFLRFFAVFVVFLIILFLVYLKIFTKHSGVISPVSKYFITGKSQILLDDSSGKIKSLLEKENFSINYIQVASDSSIKIFTKDGEEFIFSTKKDVSSQIASLQAINTRLTIEGKRLKTADFRFDNPVVTF